MPTPEELKEMELKARIAEAEAAKAKAEAESEKAKHSLKPKRRGGCLTAVLAAASLTLIGGTIYGLRGCANKGKEPKAPAPIKYEYKNSAAAAIDAQTVAQNMVQYPKVQPDILNNEYSVADIIPQVDEAFAKYDKTLAGITAEHDKWNTEKTGNIDRAAAMRIEVYNLHNQGIDAQKAGQSDLVKALSVKEADLIEKGVALAEKIFFEIKGLQANPQTGKYNMTEVKSGVQTLVDNAKAGVQRYVVRSTENAKIALANDLMPLNAIVTRNGFELPAGYQEKVTGAINEAKQIDAARKLIQKRQASQQK